MFVHSAVKKFISNLILFSAFIFALSLMPAQFVSAQATHGAIDQPPIKPHVDQLGQMEGIPIPGRAGLVVVLFVQVAVCVVVAIALAGHLSLPPKKKPQ